MLIKYTQENVLFTTLLLITSYELTLTSMVKIAVQIWILLCVHLKKNRVKLSICGYINTAEQIILNSRSGNTNPFLKHMCTTVNELGYE